MLARQMSVSRQHLHLFLRRVVALKNATVREQHARPHNKGAAVVQMQLAVR